MQLGNAMGKINCKTNIYFTFSCSGMKKFYWKISTDLTNATHNPHICTMVYNVIYDSCSKIKTEVNGWPKKGSFKGYHVIYDSCSKIKTEVNGWLKKGSFKGHHMRVLSQSRSSTSHQATKRRKKNILIIDIVSPPPAALDFTFLMSVTESKVHW